MTEVRISHREFALYGLSLPHGLPRYPYELIDAVHVGRDIAVGAIFIDRSIGEYRAMVLRRRVDHCWILTFDQEGLPSKETAQSVLSSNLRAGDPAESLQSGQRRRGKFSDLGGREPGEHFRLLTSTITHFPALMAVGEIYHAMPQPDENFISDFQTSNFDARLWELYLLAALREQGIEVSQPHPSPDFLLRRAGHQCWVEAVTANPTGQKVQGLTSPTFAPDDRAERLSGKPAERFAKTLRSKLQREYENAYHVRGEPFALAIADYHAPGSMTWSREALPVYLYGVLPYVVDGLHGKQAVGNEISTLSGAAGIPAGLFRDPSMVHLSAVMFSNAATFSKFNRMGLLAGFRPNGLTMERQGVIYDRSPGALEPLSFRHDVLSAEYEKIWPGGEAWCQELEVFHNPLAAQPINFDLLPGATHWFESDNEIVCASLWEHSVLSSITHVNFGEQGTD